MLRLVAERQAVHLGPIKGKKQKEQTHKEYTLKLATDMCALVDVPFFSRNTSHRIFDGIGGFDGHLAGDILLDHRLPNMGLDSPVAFGRRATSPASPGAGLAREAFLTSPFGELRSPGVDVEWRMAEDEMRRRVLDEGRARYAPRTRIEVLDDDSISATDYTNEGPEATDPEQSDVESTQSGSGEPGNDDLSNLANEAKAAQRKVHELRCQLEEQARLAHEAEVRLRVALQRAPATRSSRGVAV